MSDSSSSSAHRLPDYLRNTYSWAYLDHRTMPWLDRPVVVSAILWGNASRLMDAAVGEFAPGQRVLQAAAVYGDFSPRLARRLGDGGQLTVVDVAPIQIAGAANRCHDHPELAITCMRLARPAACHRCVGLGDGPGKALSVILRQRRPFAR